MYLIMFQSVVLTAILLHAQLALGCDLPLFAGARLFGAATNGAQFMVTADFNRDGFPDVVTTDSSTPSRSCWAMATARSNLPSTTPCGAPATSQSPTSTATVSSIWRSRPISQ